MSAYALTQDAENDLIEIFEFGIRQFGRNQAFAFLETLETTLLLLASQPLMGRLVPIIAPLIRRHDHKSHVILYIESDERVLIVAVFHASSTVRLKDF